MQSRLDSFLESITQVAIGFGIALLTQIIWFPMIGKDFTMMDNLLTTTVFTLVSLARMYSLRRLFNGKTPYQWIKNRVQGGRS